MIIAVDWDIKNQTKHCDINLKITGIPLWNFFFFVDNSNESIHSQNYKAICRHVVQVILKGCDILHYIFQSDTM